MTGTGMGTTWNSYWFTPEDARPLAVVRILAAGLGLALLWSYAGDLHAWFDPHGMIPVETATAWRSPFGASLYDVATTPGGVTVLFAVTVGAFMLLLVGLVTPVAAILSAVLWASLMHRGPMLAGPADDCLSVLLWCLAIGPSGGRWSVDRLLAARAGRPAPGPSVRAAVALGLMDVHAVAITVAGVLAQLKGDVWWDGTAAWWLAARIDSRIVDLTGPFASSAYLLNLVTHAITAFQVAFAIGIWFAPTKRVLGRIGLVAWPLVGLLAGEPAWGLAMAIFCVHPAGGTRHAGSGSSMIA